MRIPYFNGSGHALPASPWFATRHTAGLTRLAACVLALSLGLSGAARAQSTPTPATPGPIAPDAATLGRLIERIDELEAQVKALKAAQAAPAPAAADAAPSAPTYPQINFHGFGDFQYEYMTPASRFLNHFWLGDFDLYITAQISPNTSIISENVLSADPVANQWTLEAERLIFDYRASDALNIQAGRLHTQLGYYNTAFHHGTWLQNDTHRPWFLNFEDSGGILPVHLVGVSADGDIAAAGQANLHYYAQVGNGRSYAAPDSGQNPTQAVRVAGGPKAVNLALVAKPDKTPDWQFGVGLYHQTIDPGQPGMGSFAETIASASVIYDGPAWKFLNEAFVISHQSTAGGGPHRTVAGYSEISRKMGRFTPYARYTAVNSPASDPVYALIQTSGVRYGPTLGLRFDFEDYACLKLQYDQTSQRRTRDFVTNSEADGIPDDALTFQVAFTF